MASRERAPGERVKRNHRWPLTAGFEVRLTVAGCSRTQTPPSYFSPRRHGAVDLATTDFRSGLNTIKPPNFRSPPPGFATESSAPGRRFNKPPQRDNGFPSDRLQTLPVALGGYLQARIVADYRPPRRRVKRKKSISPAGGGNGLGFPLLSMTLSWSAARQERQDGQKQRQCGRFGRADWIGKLVRQGIGAGGGYFVGAAKFHHHQIVLAG